MWVELEQQLALAGGAAGGAAVDPRSTHLTLAGDDAAAVSRQGLELSALLVLKPAVLLCGIRLDGNVNVVEV